MKKQKTRRLLSIALVTLLLVAQLFSINAFGAGAVKLSLSPNYTLARAGDTVTVYVKISGVAAAGNILAAGPITVKYDTSQFQFVSAKRGSLMTDADFMYHASGAYVLLDYNDVTAGSKPIKTDGSLFILQLKVKTGVSSGSSALSVSAAPGGIANAKLQVVSVSCVGSTIRFASSISPSAIKMTVSSSTIGVGETRQLGVSYTPGNTSVKTVSWKSSNTSVASVSSTGLIKGLKVGTATISCTAKNGVSTKATITVKAAPKSIALNRATLTVGKGESYAFTSSVNSGTASYKRIFSSSNTKVATVDSAGKIKAVGTGTAKITVKTYNSKAGSCTVTVKNAPAGITVSKTSATLKLGKTLTLSSAVTGSNPASYLRSWSSSNTAVATVSAGGVISAKKIGTATITVKTFNGRSASCKITVIK